MIRKRIRDERSFLLLFFELCEGRRQKGRGFANVVVLGGGA